MQPESYAAYLREKGCGILNSSSKASLDEAPNTIKGMHMHARVYSYSMQMYCMHAVTYLYYSAMK